MSMKNTTLPTIMIILTGLFVIPAVFLASLSMRADAASLGLEVFKAQPDNPLAQDRFKDVEALLAPPRDVRLLELESVRLQRMGTPDALQKAAILTKEAIAIAPARPTLRMHDAFVLAQLGTPDLVFAEKLQVWHELAPHDGSTQPWRLALGLNKWDAMSPSVRTLLLDDAEDVCVRSGKKRTLELAQIGTPSAQMAVGLRLGRMTRECARAPADAPPILQ